MMASQIMSKEVLTIPAGAPVNDAMLVMNANDIHHLPVVNQKQELVGILSDRDLMQLPRPEFAGSGPVTGLKTPLNVPVSEFMSKRPFSVTPDTDVRDVVDVMLNHRVGAVPVVAADKHLQGIVSYTDVLLNLRHTL